MGMTAGVWMARIPAVKAQAGLSDAALGVALFAVPVGLVLGAALAERLVNRVGSALVARVAGVGNCLLAVPLGLARNLAELMAALLVFGLAGGTLDVAQNAQGVRVEAAYRRPVMTSMHSFYSLGAMTGALAGGGFAWAGVSPAMSLTAAGAAGARTDGFAGRWLLPGSPSRGAAADAAGKNVLPDRPPRRSAEARRVRRLIIALGVLGICGMVGEGAAGDWSAVYPAVIGAAASRVGLHLALGIPVLLALWIAVAAPVLAPRRGERDGGGGGTGPFRIKGRGASVHRHRRAYGMHMDDKEILAKINGLMETERELRAELADGRLSSEQERERLRSAEEALDQCWDLLRQRRARREFGEDPDAAEARPAAEVEGYQQ